MRSMLSKAPPRREWLGQSIADVTAPSKHARAPSDGAKREVSALRDLLLCSCDWTWEVDAQGRLSYLSPEFRSISPRPPRKALGRPFSDIGRWISPPADDLTAIDAFHAREPFRDAVIVIDGGKRGQRHQRLSGVPMFDDDDGRFLGYRGTALDAPIESASGEELARSRDQLASALARIDDTNAALSQALVQSEAAAHAKAEFLAKMSHELRTPLNAVIGYSEALKTGIITPGGQKHAEIAGDIATAGRQLLQMIDDMLETATIASGDVEMDLEPVALDAVINEALAEVVAAAAARRLDTRGLSAPPGINLLVDSAVAKRIFTNLLRNAITFTPEGGAVGVSVDASDPSVVDVVVWDTGPGIPEDLREHVFSPFARLAQDVYVRAADGAGLGLSQARGWAALMGGWVEVRPRPEGGSEFVVRLPKAHAATRGRTIGARSRRVA